MPKTSRCTVFLAISLALLFSLSTSNPASAMDTFFVGPRALGMAGANVASTSDTSAQYYNPAAFGFFGMTGTVTNAKGKTEETRLTADNNNLGRKDWGWDVFSLGAGLRMHSNLGELADNLSDMDLGRIEEGTAEDGTLEEMVKLANNLSLLDEPGNGLSVSLAGGTAVRFSNFAFGLRCYGQGAARVLGVDTKLGLAGDVTAFNEFGNLDLPGNDNQVRLFTPDQEQRMRDQGISDATIQILDYQSRQEGVTSANADQVVDFYISMAVEEGGLSENQTAVRLTGFGLAEVPFSYGYAFNENFAIGGNIKVMVGRVYASEIVIFDNDSGQIVENMTDEYEQSTTFGLDLGAMYRLNMFQFGLVGRNLNSPKFDGPTVTMNDGSKEKFPSVTVKPQFQAGVAFIPWETVTFEVNYDLTKNRTALEGYDTQYLRFGAEWDIARILALRGGFYKNMAEDDIGLVYTAGLGLNLWAVRFDLAGAFSAETEKFGDRNLPKEYQVVAGLSIDF